MILVGDCREQMATLPAGSARCCITSPPYWGLRDYGVAGQLGLEPTPQEYAERMVEVFREVRRVLSDDGTLWLNLGDSYSSGGRTTQVAPTLRRVGQDEASGKAEYLNGFAVRPGAVEGLMGKQLIGIPWRVAFALQADGWWLRSDIIWHKPNPMPESVTDRPTKSHEYLFLFAKSQRYYYDAKAIAEPVSCPDPRMVDGFVPKSVNGKHGPDDPQGGGRMSRSGNKARKPASARGVPVDTDGQTNGAVAGSVPWEGSTRNKRSVWTVPTSPFTGSHFATFPPALIEPCIKAGSARGDAVLDPFFGAGTTGLVASRLGRDYIGCELNPAYAEMARERIRTDAPLFNSGELTT